MGVLKKPFPLLLLLLPLLVVMLRVEAQRPEENEVAPFAATAPPRTGGMLPVPGDHETPPSYDSDEPFAFQCLPRATERRNGTGTARQVTLLTSLRTLPQLISRIFAIYAQERLQTPVQVLLRPLRHNLGHGLPPQEDEVFLETWQMADSHEMRTELNHHGSLFPTGSVGWFVPRDLIGSGELPPILHYSMFQGHIAEHVLRQFRMDDEEERQIHMLAEIDFSAQDNNTHSVIHLYEPPHCRKDPRNCVTLLAGFHEESGFFVRPHIDQFELSVRVVWLGRNLRRFVHWLHYRYLHETPQYGARRKFLVLDFSPSTLVDGRLPFSPVIMPDCKEILSRGSLHCAYTHMPVLKYHQLSPQMRHVQELVERFKFPEEYYRLLVAQYEARVDSLLPQDRREEAQLLNEVACGFVRNFTEMLQLPTAKYATQYAIGLLLPAPQMASFYGDVLRVAQEAVDAVNRQPSVLRHAQLVLRPRRVACDARSLVGAYLMYHVAEREEAVPVVGVVGPPCTLGLDAVAEFSEIVNMTTVSYGPTVTSFGPRYRNFYRTTGESRSFAAALVNFLAAFKWQRVAAISEEGLSSSYLNGPLEPLLAEHKVELLVHHRLQAGAPQAAVQDTLIDLGKRNARVVMLEVFDLQTSLRVMCEARTRNMTAAEGYVWIVPSWLGAASGPAIAASGCTRQELQEALEGQFSFHFAAVAEDARPLPHLNGTTAAEWLRGLRQQKSPVDVSEHSGFLFDAVWTFAFALDRVIRTGQLPPGSSVHEKQRHAQFVAALNATDFRGVSGPVDFRHGHSRRLPVLIGQWRQLRLLPVGREETPATGAIRLQPALIWWPANGQPPSDGLVECRVHPVDAWLHVDCDGAQLIVTLVVCVGLAILASLVFYVSVRSFYRRKLELSAQVMRSLGIDLLRTTRAPEGLLGDWELPKEQIVLNRKLGEGAFGTVYGGQACVRDEVHAVAVKTLKVGSTAEDRLDFLAEAEAMRRFSHPNVLRLLGVCLQSEPVFSVLEFMLYGDLKTYLLARRHLVRERLPDDSDVSARRLTSFTTDILRGLSYLAEQRYVHRDLACRNVLVNADRRAKIADFGMARPTGSNDYYRFSRKGLLPVRWLSPEALGSGFFTPAADVWSFGVLLFEVVSFGGFPYQGLSNNQVLEFVKGGGSMQVPAGVRPPLARLMRDCWAPDYRQRPTARQLLEHVSQHPRLVAPCLDIPAFPLHFTDSDEEGDCGALSFKQPGHSPDSGVGPEEGGRLLSAVGGGGDASLAYNPVEPLLSDEKGNSTSSLLLRYMPMCGFGGSGGGGGAGRPVTLRMDERRRSEDGDSEYTRMSITEF